MARGYEAHESFWSDAKMYFAMVMRAFLIGVLLQFSLMLFVIYQTNTDVYIIDTNTKMPASVFLKYHTDSGSFFDDKNAEIEKVLLPYAQGWNKLPVEVYKNFVDELTNDAYYYQHKKLLKWFRLSFICYLFSVLYLVLFIVTAKTKENEKYIRGGKLTPISLLNKKLMSTAKKNPLSSLIIGETLIPFEMESKHILVLGASGSGKGVLLNQLAAQINRRKRLKKTGDRIVFYDPKGEFVAKQYMLGDFIFNPFDTRSIGWNLFNEIEIEPDIGVIASSLFSAPDAKDSYWYNCAADVFRTGLVYLKMHKMTSNSELWDFFSQPLESIKTAFKTLPLAEQGALKHIDTSDSPASSSIISILQERIQFFRYLVGRDGDFSFTRFIRGKNDDSLQANLFLLNINKYADKFRPLLTLAIDCMVREILSLPDNPHRRVFFILDELGTLNRMDSILDLETVGRSKGGCLVCANQDLGRIEEKYGRANLKSFYNNFNTTFIFRIKEPETAEFLSRAIGEQQVIKSSQSRQMSPNDIGDRKSISEQEKTERLILATEFQDLPDRTAIINIAGIGVSKIEIPPVYYKERYPNFVMRDFNSIDDIKDEVIEASTTVNGDKAESVAISSADRKKNFMKLKA